MHPSIILKYKRYEAKIKILKKVIDKRNRLFHDLRMHYEDPKTALAMMVKLIELKEKWKADGLELMDYLILLAVQDKNLFYMPLVEQVVAANSLFNDGTRMLRPTVCLKRLINKGYVKMYHKYKMDNYFITTSGRVFLQESGREVFKMVRGTMK